MLRGLADDLPLDIWLKEHIFPAEASLVTPESVEKWSLHSCREMLLSGTTTFCDGYFYEEYVARAVMKSGMRAVLAQAVFDFPVPGVPEPSENVKTAQIFIRKLKGKSSLVYTSIFCHSLYTCSKETLIKGKKAADLENVFFQIHVAETEKEISMVKDLQGMSIVEYLDSIGILDENTLPVHAVWIDDEDISIIEKRKAKVAHCPESNMKLASGIAPVPGLIDRNVPVGLGTDGCASNNDQDFFSEMDTASKLHKVALLDPCVMDARTTLQMATVKGAEAIGLDRPHLKPLHDPYSSLVYSAKSSDVSLVMVDGEILVENTEFKDTL